MSLEVVIERPDGETITLNNTDLDGYTITSLIGWYDLVRYKNRPQDQPTAHGAYPLGELLRESRSFSIGVNYRGDTDASTGREIDWMNGFAAETPVRVTVKDHHRTSWRDAVAWVDMGDVHRPCTEFTATFEFYTEDSRRYGPVIKTIEGLSAGGVQTNLAANGRPNSTNNWFEAFGPSQLQAPELVDGWIEAHEPGEPRVAAVYRDIPVTQSVSRVRCSVKSDSDQVRLNLTWKSGDTILHIDAYELTPMLAGEALVLDERVVTPPEATRLTVAVENYQTNNDQAPVVMVQHLMVGDFTDDTYQDGDSLGWMWAGEPYESLSALMGTRWILDNREGTAPSVPALIFDTTEEMSDGFTVTFHGSEDRLIYRGMIPAGSHVELIPGEHAILIDGELSPTVATGRWPVVQPNKLEQLSLSANTPAAFTAECSFAKAWW